MLFIFNSVSSQISQTIDGYQKDISAFCEDNNINSTTAPALVGIIAFLPVLAAMKIVESAQEAVVPTGKILLDGFLTTAGIVAEATPDAAQAEEVAPGVASAMTQATLFLAGKAGSYALQGMHQLYDKLTVNDASDACCDDYERVDMFDDAENAFVIVTLVGNDSDPIAPVDAGVY